MTLAAYTPAAGTAAAPPSTAPVLHAVLAPKESATARIASETANEIAAAAGVEPIARAGAYPPSPGSLDLPQPEKWYTAAEVDVRAEPLTRENLEYPAELGDLGPSATVRVRLFIDERGLVRRIAVERSGPDRAFDHAAVQGWQTVRFSPALKDGVAVKSQKLLEVEFTPALAALLR